MGRYFLSAVRFSWPMVFTVPITMVPITMADPTTAAFTEAEGEGQADRRGPLTVAAHGIGHRRSANVDRTARSLLATPRRTST